MDNKKRKILDMHSHLLPGIDDGCQDQKMALTMLKQASDQQVDAMVCTPHYYPVESISSFLKRRQEAIEQLVHVIQSAQFRVPDIYVGGEVAWYDGLLSQPDLMKLCILGTNYMLLELPFYPWNSRILYDVQALRQRYNIHPVIAHLERYMGLTSRQSIENLLKLPVLVQMNGKFLLERRNMKTAKRLISTEVVDLLGSDTHHPRRRPQTMGDACSQLENWGMSDEAERISATSQEVLRSAIPLLDGNRNI